ncbi:MAG: chemotaxis protein CheW [Burkholderiaceae bacterium]|jgi:chemotaxis signal transduction protein|nr:chemotaxis protein CheW [Burkholderiaceae bacterium]MEB2350944.1 chemotaxis protein CheW [Burkholderiaceae bacterium]
MSSRPLDEASVAPSPATRFATRLGGVAVALPAGTPLEFVADAAIHPLPLAPARIAGLMQLRGQPLVVLDASARPAGVATIERRDVLVMGRLPQAAALLVDGPPRPLVDGQWHPVRSAPPDCAFASAIDVAGQAPWPARDAGEALHEIDPERLFAALLGG